MDVQLSRRHLLLFGSAAALTGCTTTISSTSSPTSTTSSTGVVSAGPSSPGATGASTIQASPSGAPTSSTSSAPSVGTARLAWTPDANDVSPQVKLIAAQHVEASVSEPVVEVVFAQYGGILTDSASVLVVTHPWPTAVDPATGATYDVRLARSGNGWHVTDVHPSVPGAAASATSAAARQVLADPRIVLPPAGRADIASGQVHDSVLTTMLTLAQAYRIGVSVVRSGHPTYVFGTSRLSDHPFGRAFDTWRIDDQIVVARSTPRSLVTAYMQAAARAGSYNVGGPYLLSGAAFFSDPTHHDHVHTGFRA